MPVGTDPIVYISYRWIDIDGDDGRPARAPDPRARELADRLRAHRMDVRLDVYFLLGEHGFRQPQLSAEDPRDPWLAWAVQQVAEADAVILFCTPQYVQADPDGGARMGGEWGVWSQLSEATRIGTRVPSLWWDWYAMDQEINKRPQKFIPIGLGPYHSDLVPAFVRGASYTNISDAGGFDALVRRIRQVWRERQPRQGVFISYAHKDDPAWRDELRSHLSWLERQHGVKIWDDRQIEPGARWHEEIQGELDLAKVAVLLVSPNFLNSEYIINDELPEMLKAAESDGLTIFWIPVRPSAYKHSPIEKFQAAHSPDTPLSGLPESERDQAFVAIAEKMFKALGLAAA
jgi:hypothetical protein